jgi:hypothetical protein
MKSPNRFSLRTLAFAAALLVAIAAPSLAADRWFHVHVQEGSTDGAEVRVNLPLSLIEMAASMIPAEFSDTARLELDETDFSLTDLRRLWDAVREGEDATFVTVREREHTIEVRKEGSFFVAETVGQGDVEVNVRFPLQVIDALFSGPADRLDIGAAVRALADYGDGDMVTIRDGGDVVRVWVDDTNTSL